MSDKSDSSLIHRNQLLTSVIRRHVDQLAAINQVAATVSQSLELQTTLQTALEAVLGVIKVDSAGISLVDEIAGELVLRAQHGWRRDFVSEPMRIPLGLGISGIVVGDDEVVVTGNLTDDPRLAVPEFADEGINAMAMIPMHAGGSVVGILSVMNHEPYQFSDEEIAMLRAIADQVGVALANARLFEQTKEQSSRLHAVLNSSGDAIMATDNFGQVNLFNATAAELFALNAGDVLGLPIRDVPLPERLREGLRRAINSESEGDTVFEVVTPDERFFSAIVSPVYAYVTLESNQTPEGWVLVVQDVTHLRRAEQARVNFIHAAAHDLRNPLGVTLSALHMLEQELADAPDGRFQEIIDIGVQGIDRMQDLIDNLLNLEHIQSGVGLKNEPVDLRDVIERGIIDITPCLQSRDQQLQFSVPDELPVIQGDAHWLYRALFNLLSNANKYTPEGGMIALVAFVQDDDLRIEVRDNGPGILPEAQKRLFERFYRAPNVDESTRGSGLGLAIVKSVVEQHSGRVYVQSKLGQGSTFGMAFPITPLLVPEIP